MSFLVKIPSLEVIAKLDKTQLGEIIYQNMSMSGYFIYKDKAGLDEEIFPACSKATFEEQISLLIKNSTSEKPSNTDKLRTILVEQGRRFEERIFRAFNRVADAFITIAIECDKKAAIPMVRKDLGIMGSAFDKTESAVASRMKTILPEELKDEEMAAFELIVDAEVDDEFKSNSEMKDMIQDPPFNQFNPDVKDMKQDPPLNRSTLTTVDEDMASSKINKSRVVDAMASGLGLPTQINVTSNAHTNGNNFQSTRNSNLNSFHPENPKKDRIEKANTSSTVRNDKPQYSDGDGYRTGMMISTNQFDTLPYFGDKVDDNVQEWLKKVEVIAKRQKLAKDRILEFVFHKLKGSAYEIASKMIDEENYDWDKFKKTFIDGCCAKDIQFQIRDEISSIKMSDFNYNYKTFLYKFQSLSNRSVGIDDDMKLFFFLKGLPTKIKNDIINQGGDKELDKAQAIANRCAECYYKSNQTTEIKYGFK